MQKIECCNTIYHGRIYNIGSNSFLVYVDECNCCGQSIAEIRHRSTTGDIITSARRKGKAADKLLKKYGIQYLPYEFKTFSGTRAKEYSFNNVYGIVYNDNGVRIAPQDKFLQMTRLEINAIINKRFYAPQKVKI